MKGEGLEIAFMLHNLASQQTEACKFFNLPGLIAWLVDMNQACKLLRNRICL